MRFFRASWSLGKWCTRCAGRFVLWTFWLVLCLVLVAQLYVVSSRQLPMPGWMLRQLETRLQQSGLAAQFGSATIDPTGRVLLRDLQLSTRSLESPLLTAGALYLRLDLWALVGGRFEPRESHAADLALWLPAMLSPSGQNETIVSEASLRLRLSSHQVQIEQLSGRMSRLTFSAHGAINLPDDMLSSQLGREGLGGVADAVVQAYLRSARQLAEVETRLAHLEQPHLDVEFIPTVKDAANARLTITSTAGEFDLSAVNARAGQLTATALRASATVPLAGTFPLSVSLEATCAQAKTSTGYAMRSVRFVIGGDLEEKGRKFTPRNAWLTCEGATVPGVSFDDISLRATSASDQIVQAELYTRAAGTQWLIQSDADLQRRAGHASVEGAITPFFIERIAERAGVKPEVILSLSAPAPFTASADFGEGWKLQRASGRLRSGPLLAHSAPLDWARGKFDFDGHLLTISDIILRQGENLAFGSFSTDTDKDFRFLLYGKLRPMAIAGLFGRWWSDFWSQNFDFTAAVPVADVDVRGRWGLPYTVNVFVHADTARPALREVPFDRVRATMFIRPDYYDGVDFIANRGDREARGTFIRSIDFYRGDHDLRFLSFDVKTNLDLTESARLFGKAGAEMIAPFYFAQPPSMRLSGRIDGPASDRPAGELVNLAVDSTGGFALFGFPLSDLKFNGVVRNDNLDLRDIEVSFAQGRAHGRAFLSGKDEARRLSFDAKLDGANLGEAIRTLEEYAAKEKGLPPPPESRFQKRVTQGQLSLALAADGMYRNPLSFRGDGTLRLDGSQLAEINLLGALSLVLSKSSLFSFTSLQLTSAASKFHVEREKVTFPELKITGPTAEIEADGSYNLSQKHMDFNARVYPFERGKTLLANAVGFMLVPLSNALELRLTGALDKPDWRFAYGPTSFLRTLAGTNEEPAIKTAPVHSPSNATTRKGPPPLLRR